MHRRNYLRVALFLGLALMMPSLMRCQCQPEDYCEVATDCEDQWWYTSECSAEDGHWECNSNTCSAKCGELVCDSGLDCMVLSWPADAGCEGMDGYWECRDGACVAVCSNGECAQDSECATNTWPADAECAEADGHWECQSSSCVAVCDSPECKVADDCSANSWPADAACEVSEGHWECQTTNCVAVCDSPECTIADDCSANSWPVDAGCEAADGHWECQDGTCIAMCDLECTIDEDCDDGTWPLDKDCEAAHGHWECQDGVCVAICNEQCDDAAGCSGFEWGVDCSGHFDCVLGMCNPVCDDVGCSDGECNEEAGETETSCPEDCSQGCALAMDCTGSDWELPCDGRWECTDSACVGVCDYDTCGDNTCDNANGESSTSCPGDCMSNCQLPIDCVGNTWTQMCQGVWSCYLGQCKQVCESNSCGDGVCSADMGESATSCFKDCHGGACELLDDCIGLPWLVDCDGNWVCDESSKSCLNYCEGDNCGDGNCDIQGGEDTGSCAADCGSEYACTLSSDCSDLTLPGTCTEWMCVRQVCVPICN